MSERNAEFFEIAVRQLAQNLGVDIVLPKQRLVLAETEAAKPVPDVHSPIQSADLMLVEVQKEVQRNPGPWPLFDTN